MTTYRIRQATDDLGLVAPHVLKITDAMHKGRVCAVDCPPTAIDTAINWWGPGRLEQADQAAAEFLGTGAVKLPFYATIAPVYLNALGEFLGAYGYLASLTPPSGAKLAPYQIIKLSSTALSDMPDFWMSGPDGRYSILECRAVTEPAEPGLTRPLCSTLQESAASAQQRVPLPGKPPGPNGGALLSPPAERSAIAATFLRDRHLTGQTGQVCCPAGGEGSCTKSCLCDNAAQLILTSPTGEPGPAPGMIDPLFHALYQAVRAAGRKLPHLAQAYFLEASGRVQGMEDPQWTACNALLGHLLVEWVAHGLETSQAMVHAVNWAAVPGGLIARAFVYEAKLPEVLEEPPVLRHTTSCLIPAGTYRLLGLGFPPWYAHTERKSGKARMFLMSNFSAGDNRAEAYAQMAEQVRTALALPDVPATPVALRIAYSDGPREIHLYNEWICTEGSVAANLMSAAEVKVRIYADATCEILQ